MIDPSPHLYLFTYFYIYCLYQPPEYPTPYSTLLLIIFSSKISAKYYLLPCQIPQGLDPPPLFHLYQCLMRYFIQILNHNLSPTSCLNIQPTGILYYICCAIWFSANISWYVVSIYHHQPIFLLLSSQPPLSLDVSRELYRAK